MFSDGMLSDLGRLVTGKFSDGMLSDGTFSDWMFSDGTFNVGMFCMRTFLCVGELATLSKKCFFIFLNSCNNSQWRLYMTANGQMRHLFF